MEKVLRKAGEYLSCDENQIEGMVSAIINNQNQNELIDYIDGVQVCQKSEFEFTCKEFLELIHS